MAHRPSRAIPLAVILTMALGACGSDDDAGGSTSDVEQSAPQADLLTVTGALTYLQRIALEPNGTATITLEDISRADASAIVIAEQVIELDGQQVPIPFELEADRSELDERFSYSVRGTITGPDGELRWTTDTVHPVDPTQSSVDLGELVMVQVVPSDG